MQQSGFGVTQSLATFSCSISSIRCSMLGSITCIKGQVTRTTDVRPELLQGAFACGDCGHVEEGVAQAFKYTQVKR